MPQVDIWQWNRDKVAGTEMDAIDELNTRGSFYDASAVESFRRRYRLDPHVIRRLRYALFQQHSPWQQVLPRLTADVAAAVPRAFQIGPLAIVQQRRSEIDPSVKLLLQAQDGQSVETVLMRAFSGRTSVCVSSQVGCAAGCPFCATARMGLRRQLSADEILEQIRIAAVRAREEGWRMRNVVFMGMGEPLDNEAALYQALAFLTSQDGFAIPPRRLMVSTVGVPAAMARLVDRFPGVQLALSLHSARPELRQRLVPWTRRHSWDELRTAIVYVATQLARRPKAGPIMIEYIMLQGINDGDDDADALLDYLQGIPACINLIPYNPVSHALPWRASPRERRDAFAQRLRLAGYFTTIRYSMGTDIQAACGQLATQSTSVALSARHNPHGR
jgi:23S rRNA (adenine2503-C2)-methyltransferase